GGPQGSQRPGIHRACGAGAGRAAAGAVARTPAQYHAGLDPSPGRSGRRHQVAAMNDTVFTLSSLAPALPEIYLATAACVLLLAALLGVFVLASAANLITVYIGVELLALSVYGMVAFDRDSGIAAEAAMKYFVLGAIASGTLLYGMSLIYGLTGTLSLDELATNMGGAGQDLSIGVILGLVFIVVAV